MQKETKFKNKVLTVLKLIDGIYFDKIQQLAKKGSPDFYLCVAGQFEAWELKTEEGSPSKLQEHVLDKIKKAGGTAIIVTPANYKEHLNRIIMLAGKRGSVL